MVSQVVWRHRELCSLQQANSSLRDGHEGQRERLPPGLLRVPALQSEVSYWTAVPSLKQMTGQARFSARFAVLKVGHPHELCRSK